MDQVYTQELRYQGLVRALIGQARSLAEYRRYSQLVELLEDALPERLVADAHREAA